MKMDIRLWLITTDHLEDGLWFREEDDFKVGMNYIAVLAASLDIAILAFSLMSNHVHFVVLGTEADANEFINEFKRRYSKYYERKYGIPKFLKGNHVDIQPIPFEEESPERAIAYVQMNSVAAGICLHPTQYPWSTGGLFFQAATPKGIRVDSLSERTRYRLLNSKASIPGHWLIGEGGYILPSSYVRTDYVEKLFRKPHRMEYFLRNSSKAKLVLNADERTRPSFKDQLVHAALPDLCRSLFGKHSFIDLSSEQKKEVLRQLRYRFSSNIHQLSRIAGLDYNETAKLLDSQ